MSEDKWGAGDESKWNRWGTVKIGNQSYPLIYGENKHSYSDNRMYVLDGAAEPTAFDGHRILIDVHLRSHNYRKESELSGDEVRKGGEGIILADGEPVFEFFFRDIGYALRKAATIIGQLEDHASDWLQKEKRAAMKGRKIFYHGHPAVISGLVTDQGCVMISTEDGEPFPPVPWRSDDDERESTIKDGVLSPHIWWWRD
jgi:hypothetical protein